MIDKKLIDLIIQESKLSKPSVYRLFKEKRKDYSFTIDNEQAAALVALDFDIDISKLSYTKEELASIWSLVKGITIKKDSKPRNKIASEIKFKEVNKELKVDVFLPRSLVNDANKMANIYQLLFLFENSVRNIIKLVLEKKAGSNWWESCVKPQIKTDVEKRIKKENIHRWHGKRGKHKISYTNIGDLKAIIARNVQDFKNIFPSFEWIKIRIDEIELSRNVVAHNNPLSDDDIKRVKLYYNDWLRQIKGLKFD